MSQFTTNKKIFSDKNKIQVALSCVILLFLWEIIALKINNNNNNTEEVYYDKGRIKNNYRKCV